MVTATLDTQVEDILTARRMRQKLRGALYLGLLVFVIWSIDATIVADTDWDRLGGIGAILDTVGQFIALDLSSALLVQLAKAVVVTFMMACLGTAFAVVLATPVIWFSAKNITPVKTITYPLGRAIMTLSRSVHEIVWGLIFVSAVGLGAFPGILAIAVRSIGFISKTTAEAIEDVEPGPIEAIKAVGGNQLQVIVFGVIPQIIPTFVGNVIFQWDINIRRSTIMGLVGAGGLGLTLHRQFVMFNYPGVTTVIVAIFCLVAIGEVTSYFVRGAIT